MKIKNITTGLQSFRGFIIPLFIAITFNLALFGGALLMLSSIILMQHMGLLMYIVFITGLTSSISSLILLGSIDKTGSKINRLLS